MRKNYVLTFLLALMMMATSAVAQTVGDTMVVDNIVYKVLTADPMTVEVSGFADLDAANDSIVIPAMVTDIDSAMDYSVVAVGLGAFSCNTNANKGAGDTRNNVLVSVILPSTVDSIAAHAFRDNPNLKAINLDNVVVTGGNIFANSGGLSDIGSLAKLTTMGAYTFVFCHSIPSIETPALVTIGDGNLYDMDAITSYNIPASVTSIGSLFLGRNAKLKTVQVNWTDTADVTINPANFFRGVDLTAGGITLRVPVGTKAMYEMNTLWGQIPDANIIEQSADASLSALTINGDTVEGFDPATYAYTVLLAAGSESVAIGAIPTDSMAHGVDGAGDVAIEEGRNTISVTVTAETGATQVYTLSLVAPVEVVDVKELVMLDDIIYAPDDKKPRVNNTAINWWNAGEYIEYYVYAKEAKNISFAVLAANGTEGDSRLNVSTYLPDSAASWTLDEANSQAIPANSAGEWAVDYASNVYFNFDLEANTPVVLRLYCVANANRNSLANIYGFTLTSVDVLEESKVRMVPTMAGDEASEFLFVTHNTGVETKGKNVLKAEDWLDSTRDGAWAEYQIKSEKGGDFEAIIKMGTGKDGAYVNIGAYKTGMEAYTPNGDTILIENKNNWNDGDYYAFPLSLEAGVVYTMRINFISTINSWVGNLRGLNIIDVTPGRDATLSTLTLDGDTIDGFDSNKKMYVIDLPKGTVDVPVAGAVASDDTNAVVVIMDAATLADTTKVTVTSADGTVVDNYMVTYRVAGPYMGMAATIPGRVEFELYDFGGEGFAFHDDGGKSGDASWRPGDNVDVEGAMHTQRNVGWTGAGEWLEYTVNVAETAEYILRGRIASNSSGNIIVYVDGDSVDTYTPPATGGWQNYAITDLDTVSAPAGEHVIRMEFSGEVKLNVDYFELIKVGEVSSDASLAFVVLNDMDSLQIVDGQKSYEVIVDSLDAIPTTIYGVASHWGAMVTNAQASKSQGSMATIYVKAQDMVAADTIEITFMAAGPYSGTPAAIPGMIEFEHYDVGGEGVSYHDADSKRNGALDFRPFDYVDSEGTDSTHYNVGWTSAGEWLTYTVNVAETGEYQLRLNVSNNNGAGGLIYYVDGDSVGTYVSTSSGAWQSYRLEIMDTIAMEAGEHLIKIVYDEGIRANLDYFQFLNVANISSDASLASIALAEGVALEGFDAATMSYTVTVDSIQAISTMISAVATDAGADVSIAQASQADGSKAVITVTAQDLATVKVYEVMFKVDDTSVKDLSANANIKLYPNPVEDVLNISAKSSILSVDIYSISGAIIKQYNGIGSRNVSLNLDMNNGVYFVSVATTEGTSMQKIIIR